MVGETHQQADLVLAVGYDPVEFNYESWMSKAPLVSFDLAPADIDRTIYPVVADAVGNIGASLDALLKLPPSSKDWDLKALAERRAAMFAKLRPSNTGFGPKGALAVLREVLPQDGIMTCDVGAHTHGAARQLIHQLEGLQIEIVPRAGQQRIDIFKRRRQHQLITVTFKQVEHAPPQRLNTARGDRQNVLNIFR